MQYDNVLTADRAIRQRSAQTNEKLQLVVERDSISGKMYFVIQEITGDVSGQFDIFAYYYRGTRFERRMINGRPTCAWIATA
jgi:hypothetical protein